MVLKKEMLFFPLSLYFSMNMYELLKFGSYIKIVTASAITSINDIWFFFVAISRLWNISWLSGLETLSKLVTFWKPRMWTFHEKKGCLTFPLHFLPRYKVQTLPVLVTLLIDVHVFLFQVFLLKIGRELNTLNMRKLLNSKVFFFHST